MFFDLECDSLGEEWIIALLKACILGILLRSINIALLAEWKRELLLRISVISLSRTGHWPNLRRSIKRQF